MAMNGNVFRYKKFHRPHKPNCKYKLMQDVCVATQIKPNGNLTAATGLVLLSTQSFSRTEIGLLKIKKDYIWNGANVIWDTDANMFAALVHDALYHMMRDYHCQNPDSTKIDGISRKSFKETSDQLFCELYKKNGGRRWWTWLCCIGLKVFGKKHTICKSTLPRRACPPGAGEEESSPAEGLIPCPQPEDLQAAALHA